MATAAYPSDGLSADSAVVADEKAPNDPLAADTPTTTVNGNPFTAPAGWRLSVLGPATFVEAPEGGSRIVLVDIDADDADSAVAKAWAAYQELTWPLKIASDETDANGWSRQRSYEYLTSPNEKRSVLAGTRFADGVWTVWIYDMANEVGEKRGAQVVLVFDSLLPKGYVRESFAGKKANRLDEARLAELVEFVEKGLEITGVPGVGLGIIQDGKVVYAGGLGVREIGHPEKVDADTGFIVASNTKAMTTLLLAKLVDQGKFTWETPATDLLSSFRLGDDATTSSVLVEHLICACTGLPRKDMELILEFGDMTAEDAMEQLGQTQPTSDFGDLFQYSNAMAAAAGYIGGHVVHPDLELGAAYDQAMQTLVFDPLGMKHTTFDYERALAAKHASAHGVDVDGQTRIIPMDVNYAVVYVRPAGGAWSTVNDMLAYVAMELAEGLLPSGERYIGREALLERRHAKVPIGESASYGMGLMVDETYGVPVVHHGGDVFGHHSDMMWLPEHGVGAVVLTSGDPGWLIRNNFQRKLLEVLFDGKPEAEAALASQSRQFFDQKAKERELYEVPADGAVTGGLAAEYRNAALGSISVNRQEGGVTAFDFGEWRSEVASMSNPDGTTTLVTIGPGVDGFEFVVGGGPKKTLILRDAQHEYLFEALAKEPSATKEPDPG
ncbi:MAG: beta-lactamase family protein [Thermoanaerobaculia bacterium]|nr:beta-lactamase family protein [Thermoanaerobaculia bacterium]